MTAENPPCPLEYPAQGAIMSDCLDSVHGAGRIKTAGRWEDRRDQITVSTEGSDAETRNRAGSGDGFHVLYRWFTAQKDHRPIDMARGIKRKIGTYGDNDICMRGITTPIESKRLSEYSFNSVPDSRSFYLSADTDAESIVRKVVVSIDHAEAGTIDTLAMPVDSLEFTVLP